MLSALWFNINLANVSETNGGPLLVVKFLGVPYCEKSCVNLHVTVSAVFVEILKVKGYLLKVSVTNRYSLFLNVKRSAVRSCRGASGTSLGISGWVDWVALCWMHVLQHLTYSTMSASIPGQYIVVLALCCIFLYLDAYHVIHLVTYHRALRACICSLFLVRCFLLL